MDGEALARYGAVQGDMEARLRRSIDTEADPPCFVLTADERCPFLNRNGLCDLITELGEGALCHICADHPRFRHVLSDRVELGLGLCCEAAAGLILTRTEPFSLVELPAADAARERYALNEAEPLDPRTQEILAVRDALLTVLRDRTLPLSDRIHRVCAEMGINRTVCDGDPLGSYGGIAALLRDLERLDPSWDGCLDGLETLSGDPWSELEGETGVAYENLVCYFLYRYLPADDTDWQETPRTCVAFAILCTVLIHAIHRAAGGKDPDSLCEIARMFSSEIEYSEENTERLMEEIEWAVREW